MMVEIWAACWGHGLVRSKDYEEENALLAQTRAWSRFGLLVRLLWLSALKLPRYGDAYSVLLASRCNSY